MASTPPPSPPPPATPLTSPQRHQHAGRHQERLERVVGSPEQRRVPAPPPLRFSISAPVAGPSALPVAGPSALPVAGPSVPPAYPHLPANLRAQLAALTDFPAPRRSSSAVSASNRQPLLAPAPQIAQSAAPVQPTTVSLFVGGQTCHVLILKSNSLCLFFLLSLSLLLAPQGLLALPPKYRLLPHQLLLLPFVLNLILYGSLL